jgi:RNA polymerase sigma factor (sigma-70 family)
VKRAVRGGPPCDGSLAMARPGKGRKPASRRRRVVRSLAGIAIAAVVVANGTGDRDSDESGANKCFAHLVGEKCTDVWHGTLKALGRHDPSTHDALQSAFIYVCMQKRYELPGLCGAFRKKAERLKIDAWRYTRRFRDQPAEYEPACPLPSAEEQALTQEELDLLDDARRRLDDRSRRILDLAYRQDLTDAAIGAQLKPELSEVRVRVLRREAEQALETFLERCR